jgi:hypothetical protein
MNLLRFLALCLVTGCAFATWATCEPPQTAGCSCSDVGSDQVTTVRARWYAETTTFTDE